MERKDKAIRKGVKYLLGNLVTSRIESLIDFNPLPLGFEDSYSRLIDEGYRPIIYANHQSHSDGFALALVIENLQRVRSIRGFVLPVATSFVSGAQDKWLARAYSLTKEPLLARGLLTIPYTRSVDVERFGKTKHPEEIKEWIRLAREGYSFAVLPEASVQGGRHSKDKGIDDIYGIQEIGDDNLLSFYSLLTRGDRRAFFLPIGTHRSYRVMSPVDYRPDLSVYPSLIGLSRRKIAEVKAGMPVLVDEIAEELGSDWQRNKRGSNRFLMKKVAQLIPQQARGIY